MGKAVIKNTSMHVNESSGRSKSIIKTSSCTAVKSDNANGYEIRSVTKALDLFEAICNETDNSVAGGEEITIARLSNQLGLQKSSVFCMLATFKHRGYIEQDERTGCYRIGMNAYELGRKLLLRMPILREARPVLEELCRRCNEAVYLVVRNGSDFLMIDLVEGAQQVKVSSLLGKRFPLSHGAPGQLMLAFFPPTGIHSSADERTLQTIRQNGYCLDQGGLGEGVSSLAVPLFNAGGTIAGAV